MSAKRLWWNRNAPVPCAAELQMSTAFLSPGLAPRVQSLKARDAIGIFFLKMRAHLKFREKLS